MGLIKIRIAVNVIATVIGISFIVLAELWKQYTTLLFSIELIVLPAIYVIGNMISEDIIEQTYTVKLDKISQDSANLNENYYKLKILYQKMRVQNGKNKETTKITS